MKQTLGLESKRAGPEFRRLGLGGSKAGADRAQGHAASSGAQRPPPPSGPGGRGGADSEVPAGGCCAEEASRGDRHEGRLGTKAGGGPPGERRGGAPARSGRG